MTIRITPALRRALVLDAATSGAAALAFMAGASFIASLTLLPQALLFWAGALLVPWTCFLGWASRRTEVASVVPKDIIGVNVLWVVASLGLLVGGLVQPNAFGVALVIAQAVAVALFALLQSAALRGAPAAARA